MSNWAVTPEDERKQLPRVDDRLTATMIEMLDMTRNNLAEFASSQGLFTTRSVMGDALPLTTAEYVDVATRALGRGRESAFHCGGACPCRTLRYADVADWSA